MFPLFGTCLLKRIRIRDPVHKLVFLYVMIMGTAVPVAAPIRILILEPATFPFLVGHTEWTRKAVA